MNRKRLIVIGIIVVPILFGLIITNLSLGKDKFLQEKVGEGKDDWWRILSTEEIGDGKTKIKNEYDGYEITVPSDWRIPRLANSVGIADGLVITFGDGVTGSSASTSGGTTTGTLKVATYNNRDEAQESFKGYGEFKEIPHESLQVYRTSHPMYAEQFIDRKFQLAEVENTLVIQFLFINKSDHFVVSCSVEGPSYTELIPDCEQQISTFGII